jgi:hypothetical protein
MIQIPYFTIETLLLKPNVCVSHNQYLTVVRNHRDLSDLTEHIRQADSLLNMDYTMAEIQQVRFPLCIQVELRRRTANPQGAVQFIPLTHTAIQEAAKTLPALETIAPSSLATKYTDAELYEICDNEHATCNPACPVFAANGNHVPMTNGNCRCFKNGFKMQEFLKAMNASKAPTAYDPFQL